MMRKILLAGLFLSVVLTGKAQFSVSYKHDATKMNQITVMESGMGSLTPSWYYNMRITIIVPELPRRIRLCSGLQPVSICIIR